jgi:hypothetical protein
MNGLINVEYSVDFFNELQMELVNGWQDINPKFVFPTPIYSNIISFNLYDEFDLNFPNTINVIKEIKKIGGMYLRLFIYPPYTRTTFHKDAPQFRYVLPITGDKKYFNYEITNTNINQSELNKKFFEIDTDEKLLKFNSEFLENGNKIYNWNQNKSYLIGTNAHAHLNFSNTNRIVIVFDHKGKII